MGKITLVKVGCNGCTLQISVVEFSQPMSYYVKYKKEIIREGVNIVIG